MKYPEKFDLRLTKKQMNVLSKIAERSGEPKAKVMRRAIEILGSDDYVVVPLTVKERLFIEAICNAVGVQPPDAVKMILISYHTLMSRELWKIVKPIDQILDETKGIKDDAKNK